MAAVLRKWTPYHCQTCPARYSRRCYFETWTTQWDKNAGKFGAIVHKKVKIRVCERCAAERRHETFVLLPDLKLLLGKES